MLMICSGQISASRWVADEQAKQHAAGTGQPFEYMLRELESLPAEESADLYIELEPKVDLPNLIRTDRLLDGIAQIRTPGVLDSLLRFRAFEACMTRSIRPRLDIKSLAQKNVFPECDTAVYSRSRTLRVLICELRPVKALESAGFLKAFLDIILCTPLILLQHLLWADEHTGHFILWTRHNVYHRNLNLDILKYEVANGATAGVFIDLDLVACTGERANVDYERLGTLQNMAQELLDARSHKRLIAHHYRYDLESFYWVLIWVCNCVEDGKEVEPLQEPFCYWKSAEYDVVLLKRLLYELNGRRNRLMVLPSRLALWEIVMPWVIDLVCRVRFNVTYTDAGNSYASDASDCFNRFCDHMDSDDVYEGLQKHGENGDALLESVKDFLREAQGYRRELSPCA